MNVVFAEKIFKPRNLVRLFLNSLLVHVGLHRIRAHYSFHAKHHLLKTLDFIKLFALVVGILSLRCLSLTNFSLHILLPSLNGKLLALHVLSTWLHLSIAMLALKTHGLDLLQGRALVAHATINYVLHHRV